MTDLMDSIAFCGRICGLRKLFLTDLMESNGICGRFECLNVDEWHFLGEIGVQYSHWLS